MQLYNERRVPMTQFYYMYLHRDFSDLYVRKLVTMMIKLDQFDVDVEGHQYRCTVGYLGGLGAPAESFVTLQRKQNTT